MNWIAASVAPVWFLVRSDVLLPFMPKLVILVWVHHHGGLTPGFFLSGDSLSSTLGGEAKAIGSKLILNGEPFRVIGVMPAEFRFPVATTEYWVRLSTNLQAQRRSKRHSRFLNVFARMKPGVT